MIILLLIAYTTLFKEGILTNLQVIAFVQILQCYILLQIIY